MMRPNHLGAGLVEPDPGSATGGSAWGAADRMVGSPRWGWSQGSRHLVAQARRDAGSGTVATLGILGVLLSILVGALILTSAVLASHRARSAADLAALTGAAAIQTGESARGACQVAQSTAALNHADITCRVQGEQVRVQARVRPTLLPAARLGAAVATAQAGPAAEPAPAAGQTESRFRGGRTEQ
ncbi:Rv3654c family TadE-like protein [Gephyromycinifex aptenodytis]|uniref:Rv3654c family TadE-like protein n=1 Tax=Gephyromycinifex aptenodytis TaxID=2716227 RepID=UPI001445976E|nr:Rv3654c family TadE-like protein [Gephyromycinifex aptenodytis]